MTLLCLSLSEFAQMSFDALPAGKRPYARPVLTDFGTIADLTRAGYGSMPENKDSQSKNKRL